MAGHNLAFQKSSELRAASQASGLSPLEELLGTEAFLEFKIRNPGATEQVSFNIEGKPLAESVNRSFSPSSQNFFGGGITSRSIRSSRFIDPKFLNRKNGTAPSAGPQLSTGAQQRTQAKGQASTILSGDFGDSGLGVGRGTVAFKTLSGF